MMIIIVLRLGGKYKDPRPKHRVGAAKNNNPGFGLALPLRLVSEDI